MRGRGWLVELYEDDGKSFAHKKGDWMRVAMTWTDAARLFRVHSRQVRGCVRHSRDQSRCA